MERLKAGDFVKIKLVTDNEESERFWCKVLIPCTDDGEIIGEVANNLVFFDYGIGHKFTIKPEHVLQVMNAY